MSSHRQSGYSQHHSTRGAARCHQRTSSLHTSPATSVSTAVGTAFCTAVGTGGERPQTCLQHSSPQPMPLHWRCRRHHPRGRPADAALGR
ncbi:hypothetical protein BS50DRAFT_386368 [Corynespora cassiicola Philippines]|uniref:Uncharacterized protein n=1 Tax=Corynespora cassiicola Philippines TaxID=1448308 RepID=A0A2T2NP97_CORCC|nr:hypothetical protein BS50DRAFT_386368 [Corynespora cassiicola Philippines]